MANVRRRVFRRGPVVAPKAVQAFLERDLDDWRWLKEVPREELEALLPKGWTFVTKPRLHQLVCFVIGMKLARFMYLLDMGSGKSKIVLDLIRFAKFCGLLRTAIIVVPNVINLESWQAQLRTHAPDLTFEVLHGTKVKRYSLMDKVVREQPDVCLINFGGLQAYMANKVTRVGKSTKTKRRMVIEDAADFTDVFNFVLFDEPHLYLSSTRSISYELCQMLSWRADFAYGTTGTPFDKNPEKAWSQFHVVDQGETLGHSLGMFRAGFYLEKEHFFKGVEYRFDKSKRKLLNNVLQHRSIRYEDKEFSDLPAVNFNHIPVMLTGPQVKRYNELLTEAAEARERGEQKATWIRLRQTAAGFISVVADEDDHRVSVAFNPNGKALALEQYLLELPEDEKIVVFHEYIPSGKIIKDVLTKLKIKFTGVGSGFKDPAGNLRKFMTDPFCRVWVANSKAGGTGTDGLQQVARYGLFYETPSSPSRRKQCWKRLHRDGQQRRVYITDLTADNVAIDKRIHAGIKLGVDMFESVCSGKGKLE